MPVSNPPSYDLFDLFQHIHAGAPFAYGFSNVAGYVATTTLATGPGYWIKDSLNYVQPMTGTAVSSLAIPVDATSPGWNLIGSISTLIPNDAAHITLSQPDLLASAIQGYNNGYFIATEIEPGKGFWVKVIANGTITLHTTGAAGKASGPAVANGRGIDDLNTITIRDARGGLQTLYFGSDASGTIPVSWYAMPPLPPVGSFDARFASVEGGTMVQLIPKM